MQEYSNKNHIAKDMSVKLESTYENFLSNSILAVGKISTPKSQLINKLYWPALSSTEATGHI